MKVNMKAEPSITITYKNKKIITSDLPEEIRNEVATCDRLAQERLDSYYELEKLDLAWQAKKNQIGLMISAWEASLTEKEPSSNEKTENE